MKKFLFYLIIMFLAGGLISQTLPNTKQPSSNSCSKIIYQKIQRPKTTTNIRAGGQKLFPDKFEAFICFNKGEDSYTEEALNMLDSVYKIAFDRDNNKFYKITIIGYDDDEVLSENNSDISRQRAIRVFNYFSSREGTEYIIRRTSSKSFHSCDGETDYVIKYKMPFDFKWINLNGKSKSEKELNGISLIGKTYILIEDNPDECLGKFNNYYFPSQDTTLLTKNLSMLKIPKGSLESFTHTKDTIDNTMLLSFEECLTFEEVTKNYNLVPHKKQYIISGGYFVVKSNHQPNYESCVKRDNFPQDISLRLTLEEGQEQARLKLFARTYNPNGSWEYKAIPTKKEKDKETNIEAIIGSLSAFQLDTIYIGKKVAEKDMSNYFYPAKEGEPGAFRAMGGWLKPYKLDKRGSIVMKKEMQFILRRPNGNSFAE